MTATVALTLSALALLGLSILGAALVRLIESLEDEEWWRVE